MVGFVWMWGFRSLNNSETRGPSGGLFPEYSHTAWDNKARGCSADAKKTAQNLVSALKDLHDEARLLRW